MFNFSRKMLALVAVVYAAQAAGEELLFQDKFAGKLGEGWSWVREDKNTWRLGDKCLELRMLPGNLWGSANDVRNVLVRTAPDTSRDPLEIAVTVSHEPVHQYQQANLAWYYDDSHMVKLGLELVDGQTCIVMGREQADRIRTLAKIPLAVKSVRLRLRVDGKQIRGQYLPPDSEKWLEAAQGDLPTPPNGQAKISLHCYQGPATGEHWAKFTDLQIRRPPQTE